MGWNKHPSTSMITTNRQRVTPVNTGRWWTKTTYSEELPRDVELVVADKVRVVALEGVEDECPSEKPDHLGQPASLHDSSREKPPLSIPTYSYASGILRSEKRRL